MSKARKEQDFDGALLSLYDRTGRATVYWAHYFRWEVQQKGGLAVARKLLRPDKGTTTGFERLVAAQRADLTVEHISRSDRFRTLFTESELEEARRRLAKLPPSAFPDLVRGKDVKPDEVSRDDGFTEGDVVRVSVNRYERDQKARS
jgi:5-methylcytosine-specific restriction enzyme A